MENGINCGFAVGGLLFGRPFFLESLKIMVSGQHPWSCTHKFHSSNSMLLRNEKAHSVTPATSYYWHISISSTNCPNEPFWQEHVVGNLAPDTIHS
jgi:hypothetical protein